MHAGPAVTRELIQDRPESNAVAMATSNAHSHMSASVSTVKDLIPQSVVNPSKSDLQVSRGEAFDVPILQEFALSMSTLLS